jgi:hypothetical protein
MADVTNLVVARGQIELSRLFSRMVFMQRVVRVRAWREGYLSPRILYVFFGNYIVSKSLPFFG